MIIYTNSWMKNVAEELFPEAQFIDALEEREKFLENLKDATGIFGSGFAVTEKFLSKAPRLKAVSLTSVGYDHCDVTAMKNHNVMLTNTPDILTEGTADLGFALLMACGRRITEGQDMVRNGEWKTAIGEEIFGTDIYGKTLGIVGMGRIGQAIGKRGALGFDMKVLYQSRKAKKTPYEAQKVELEELLQKSDYVVVTTALTSDTKNLIGQKELMLMKKSGILINISRGPVVDEEALYEALKSKTIRSAGLDVFNKEPLPGDSKLRELTNVVLTPHIGSATFATREGMVRVAAENLRAALSGEKPKNLVTQ